MQKKYSPPGTVEETQRSRADDILDRVNPEVRKLDPRECGYCGSTNTVTRGGLGHVLVKKCWDCKMETPIHHVGDPRGADIQAAYQKGPPGPYYDRAATPVDPGTPTFRRKSKPRKTDD